MSSIQAQIYATRSNENIQKWFHKLVQMFQVCLRLCVCMYVCIAYTNARLLDKTLLDSHVIYNKFDKTFESLNCPELFLNSDSMMRAPLLR